MGYGHLSRAVHLAKGFIDAGHPVRFFCQGEWPGFIEDSLERTATLEALLVWSAIVICDGVLASDLPGVSNSASHPVVVQVDDAGSNGAGARVIINPNLYGDRLCYPDDKVIFAGPDYNLIPPSMFLSGENGAERRGVVISFGGSDFGQYGTATASAMADLTDGITLLLACDESQSDTGIVASLRLRGVDVLFRQPAGGFLKACELYVGAAGVTSLEALAAGCKIAVCSIVDNQRPNTAILQQKGYAALDGFDAAGLAGMASKELASSTPHPVLLSESGIPRVVQALVALQLARSAEG